MVNPTLLPFTLTSITTGNLKPVKIGQYYVPMGRRFGTGKYGQKTPEKIQMARQAQMESLELSIKEIERFITKTVEHYADYLMRYWYSHVDQYFNRSSHARYYPSMIKGYRRTKHIPMSNDRNRLRKPHKMSTKSNQLRHALHPITLNAFGCRLYTYPCYSRSKGHGKTDYVNILILGAPEKFGNHYVPDLNRRLKGGSWGGISARYWGRWYTHFNREVEKVEARMNMEIKIYMDTFMKRSHNQILFNMQVMNSAAKSREFKTYNEVKKRRANAEDEFSDVFKNDTEYSKAFSESVNTKKALTWDELRDIQREKRNKMRRR